MASDKSLNIRDIKAKEETAAAMTELRQRLEAMQAQLERIEAAMADLSRPATKLQEAARSTVTRNK